VLKENSYLSSLNVKQEPICSNDELVERLSKGWGREKLAFTPGDEFIKKVESGFGLLVMFDAYNADKESLTNMDKLFDFLYDFPEAIGMTRISGPDLLEYSGKDPADWGVTGSVVLAESMVSIHTFPSRDNFVTVDIYSCKCFSPHDVVVKLKEYFKTEEYECSWKLRGSKFKRNHEPYEATEQFLRKYTPTTSIKLVENKPND